jgi:hypothetical protein
MKKWYHSRTMWVNIISITLEVINMLMANPIIPPKFAGFFTILVNVLNMVLRLVTTSPIEGVEEAKKPKDREFGDDIGGGTGGTPKGKP